MSTEYLIADDNAGSTLELVETSGKVFFLLRDESLDNTASTVAVFTDEDLIKMCMKILRVASYISEDAEDVRARLNKAIENDSYLKGMVP